jgi:hypothetical protein
MAEENLGEDQEPRTLFIRSEEDAYDFLERSQSESQFTFTRVEFQGWPTLELSVKGDKFNQSITPSVMKGLLEFQKSIYKSFAIAKYGSSSKRLTELEREQLEIKVSVNKGSSVFGINFTEIANHAVDQLTGILPPSEIAVVVVMIAAMAFGRSAYGIYLEDRRISRKDEVSAEYQKAVLDALTFKLPQQEKRANVIEKLAEASDLNKQIYHSSQEAQHAIVKSIGAGTQGRIGDTISISKEASEILSANPRRKSTNVRLDGKYRIVRIDWSGVGVFRVRIESSENGMQLDADVEDESLDGKHKEAIKAAEWSRKPVELQINARSFGENDYRDVVIVSAQPIEK